MAEKKKSERKAEPGSLLSQWWTLGRIACSGKTVRGSHLKAAWVIVDAFRRDEGNGRASISYIQNATGMDRKAIVKAGRDLAEWGFVRRYAVNGIATEYEPIWVASKSVADKRPVFQTSGDSPPSGDSPTGGSGDSPTGSAKTWGAVTTEDYLLPTYKTGGSRVKVSACASRAPLEGAGPATGSRALTVPDAIDPRIPPASDNFERCWAAYRKLGNKQASRKAFAAIQNPDVDHIAERAASWAASAKGLRMPFEKWLAQEKYDEADRRVQREPIAENENAEDDDVPRKKRDGFDAAADAERARARWRAAIDIRAPSDVPLKVTSSRLEERGEDTWLALDTDGGAVACLVEGGTGQADVQEEGQAHLSRLIDACGRQIDGAADVVGCTFRIVDGTFAAVEGEAAQ